MSRPHLSLQVVFQSESVYIMILSMGITVPCICMIVYVSRAVGSVGLLKEQPWYPPIEVQLPPQYCRTEIHSYSFFLGDSPASDFYMLTFWNTLSVPSSWAV